MEIESDFGFLYIAKTLLMAKSIGYKLNTKTKKYKNTEDLAMSFKLRRDLGI